MATALAVGVLACVYEPPIPPADDTGGSDDNGSGGDDGPADVVFDGNGRGVLQGPYWAGAPNAILIGSPSEGQGNVAEAGEINVLVNIGGVGIGLPQVGPTTLIEETNDEACTEDHRFAYQLLPNRAFGGALSFYSNTVGGGFGSHGTGMLAAAPTAASDSGRVMQFGPETTCFSCVMFPRAPEDEALYR